MNNSVALVADAFHMLSDVISLIVGLVAVRFQKKSTANPKFTFGYLRAEVVGALCNSVFLLALCFTIIIDAINALIEPERMSEPKQVLIVGGIGLFINLVGLFLFSDSSDGHGHSHGGSGQDSHAHSHSLPNPFKKFKKSKNHQHKQSKKSQVQPELIEPPNLPHVHLEDEVSSKGSHKNLPASIYENESPRSDNTDKNKPTNVTNNPTNQLLQIKERTTPIKQHHDQHNHEHNEYHDHHADYETDDEEEMTKKERNMNIQGVYLHVLGDALGSVIVMISAGIVLYAQQKIEPKNIDLNQLISSNNQTTSMTVAQLSEFVEQHHETNWSDYADPVLSIIITMIILKSTWILFIDSAKIVLQISPDSINPAELKGLIIDKILQHFDKEISIHDFHVWQLSSQRKIASLHVKIPYSLTDNWPKAMSIIKNIFHKKGVHNWWGK